MCVWSTSVCLRMCTYVCVCACVHAPLCVHDICVSERLCVVERQTETQRDRETEGGTDSSEERDRKRERERERESAFDRVCACEHTCVRAPVCACVCVPLSVCVCACGLTLGGGSESSHPEENQAPGPYHHLCEDQLAGFRCLHIGVQSLLRVARTSDQPHTESRGGSQREIPLTAGKITRDQGSTSPRPQTISEI